MMTTPVTQPRHLILSTPHNATTDPVTPGTLSDQSPTGRALNELERLVTELRVAHHNDDHLRALSSLVAIQPLVGLLSSIKQQHLETDDDSTHTPADHTNDRGYV